MLLQSFELMGLGMIGVFAALTILYFVTRLMTLIFPGKKEEAE